MPEWLINNWEEYLGLTIIICGPIYLFFLIKKYLLAEIFEMRKKSDCQFLWKPW